MRFHRHFKTGLKACLSGTLPWSSRRPPYDIWWSLLGDRPLGEAFYPYISSKSKEITVHRLKPAKLTGDPDVVISDSSGPPSLPSASSNSPSPLTRSRERTGTPNLFPPNSSPAHNNPYMPCNSSTSPPLWLSHRLVGVTVMPRTLDSWHFPIPFSPIVNTCDLLVVNLLVFWDVELGVVSCISGCFFFTLKL